jgi:two-component system chemotaxis response regulator CheY
MNKGVETLIIEDSAPTRKLLRARLEALGCEIVGEAENPSDGLRMFRELEPHIVTLDLIMPVVEELTTEELFRIIRNDRPDASIIVISSSSKAATAVTFLAQGAIAYLEKPFVNFEHLREKLDSLYPGLKRKRMNGSMASLLTRRVPS